MPGEVSSLSDSVLVFSTSDKGGTGRSVTSCNLAYRLSAKDYRVAYLDFDFGSPTSGALFEIEKMDRGVVEGNGLHQYFTGAVNPPVRYDIRSQTNRENLRAIRHPYELTLFPGDRGGGEFAATEQVVKKCIELMVICQQEFDVIFVDLSSGRSAALEIVLRATAAEPLQAVESRWLVFHRWTRQHILAANGLVHGPNGLLETGTSCGHDAGRLLDSVRYVRTAVPDTNEGEGDKDRGPQWAWLREQNRALEYLAQRNQLGESVTLGTTPVEPMLQWREQLILDSDVDRNIANKGTVEAFEELADGLMNVATWERLY
ncbi:hypothetical protein AW168_19760 [Nocardia brasiliensis]|nr:hypothetical protein AW168_19760 [Nocardia brasiliensis]